LKDSKKPNRPVNYNFSKLPGVDTLLADEKVKFLLQKNPSELISFLIKDVLKQVRSSVAEGETVSNRDEIIALVTTRLNAIRNKSLKPVINATGVIIHTNLGRSPFGKALLDDASEILNGYSNLEYDLDNAKRGSRYVHVTEILKYLTGAEDVLVVNNNAAAIMLVLRAFAKDREVVISRGELIEIGGSFRMPDIMKTSDCEMIEVGTTNKTSITDYKNAVNKNTALLLKVHQSNYVIKGFTHEASLTDLVKLNKETGVPVVYDMGSGLLRKPQLAVLKDEPDVRTTLATGIDLVTFSGDKLLGGPQAGIIAGKAEFIKKLKNEPMTRALRVGKETLALLESLCVRYLDEQDFFKYSPIYQMMTASLTDLKAKAERLNTLLSNGGLHTQVVDSCGQPGGGSLPDETIESFAVQVSLEEGSRKEKTEFAEAMYQKLLKHEKPVLGVLRKGKLIFDILAIDDNQLELVAEIMSKMYKEVTSND